jgi:hypothetical protein
VKRSDLPRVAQALAELGQVLGRQAVIPGRAGQLTVAEVALDAARGYQPGQQAARLEPSHGRRMEEVHWTDGTSELVDVPHDPAGEAAVALDTTLDLPERWLDLMAELDTIVARARKLLDVLLPPQPNTQPSLCGECGAPRLVPAARDKRQTELDVATEGWCRSCYRDDQRLEPIDTDRRGNRIYKDVCRWCGRFRREHEMDPPLEIVRYHHRYGRVPAHLVDKAVTKAKRAAPTTTRKKKRK